MADRQIQSYHTVESYQTVESFQTVESYQTKSTFQTVPALHMLIPDGVYSLNQGRPRFRQVTAPSQSELSSLLNRIIRRITRQLTRDGLLAEEADQSYLDLQADDTLDHFGAASLQYRVVLGPNAGSRILSLRNPVGTAATDSSKPFTAVRNGFSLNAAVN